MNKQKYDVFISYSSKDVEIAKYLCKRIEENGLKCWIAPRNEVAGVSYAKQIIQAISNSSVFLVCFSQYANKSEHVESEIDNAFSNGKVLIPFRVDNCEMSAEMKYYLNKKHWQNGIPVDEKTVDSLISSIIANIPERAKVCQVERSVENVLEEVNMLEQFLKKDGIASLKKNSATMKQLEKFRLLSKSIIDVCDAVDWEDMLAEFIKTLPDKNETGDSCYDLLTNAVGELILFIGYREEKIESPRFVFCKERALLFRSPSSIISIDDLNTNSYEALKGVCKILVVEIKDDDVVQVYEAKVENLEVEDLGADNGLSSNKIKANCSRSCSWLYSEKEGLVCLIPAISGMPDEMGARAIYDKEFKEMLIYKNRNGALIVSLPEKSKKELFDNSESISIVEIYNEKAVAKYSAELRKIEKLEL